MNEYEPEGYEYIIGVGHVTTTETSAKGNSRKKKKIPFGFRLPEVKKPARKT